MSETVYLHTRAGPGADKALWGSYALQARRHARSRARRRTVDDGFLARPPELRDLRDVAGALGIEVLAARDSLAVSESQAQVVALAPDMARVVEIDVLAVICTAPGEDCDFVSRFFAPGAGAPEDPVTDSHPRGTITL